MLELKEVEEPKTSHIDTAGDKARSVENRMQLPLNCLMLICFGKFKNTICSSSHPIFSLIVVHNKNYASNI
jgi:hypothetical protein